MKYLCISVRWFDCRYHGLLSRDGPPEWPPSPFRLFQALVAGVARRGELDGEIGKSLEWLQGKPPLIVAPRSQPGQVITRFVPNNDGDKVLDRQKRLTAKTSCPTIMLDSPEVHYMWCVDDNCPHERLIEASRLLSCLGWGIDMAHADARLFADGEAEKLSGVRWLPRPDALRDDGLLRVPNGESMADLRRAHESALGRIEHGKPLRTVYKPRLFDRVFYESAERPLGRPFAVFALRTSGDTFYAYPQRKLIHIAGMTRRAAIKAMDTCPPEGGGYSAEWIESFVAGHKREGSEDHLQLSYIPVPSIGDEHSDAMVRRVMITAPWGHDAELHHLTAQLDGSRLEPEGGGEGPILDRIRTDGVTRMYVEPSAVWVTVTPIVLPGHDDHKATKTSKLIERALQQSGIDQPCKFTWSALPHFANCLTAHKYDSARRSTGYYRPQYLESLTAIHLRVTFERPVAGPLLIGSGRHCGLGVLANPLRPTA